MVEKILADGGEERPLVPDGPPGKKPPDDDPQDGGHEPNGGLDGPAEGKLCRALVRLRYVASTATLFQGDDTGVWNLEAIVGGQVKTIPFSAPLGGTESSNQGGVKPQDLWIFDFVQLGECDDKAKVLNVRLNGARKGDITNLSKTFFEAKTPTTAAWEFKCPGDYPQQSLKLTYTNSDRPPATVTFEFVFDIKLECYSPAASGG